MLTKLSYLLGLFTVTVASIVPAPAKEIDLSQYQPAAGISAVSSEPDKLQILWPISNNTRGKAVFDLRDGKPLIESFGLQTGRRGLKSVARALDPVTTLTVGQRDKKKYDEAFRGMVFFENPREKPFTTHPVSLNKRSARVTGAGPRVTVSIGDVTAGPFRGELSFTFFSGTGLILAETILSTEEELRAILYDTGLGSATPDWEKMVWRHPLGDLQTASINPETLARTMSVKQRTLVAEGRNGSLAILPLPHRYFYPLDFADNFEFNWFGQGYSQMPAGFGFGIRQPPEGDRRWVPWFDAPPGKQHHLGVFYLLSPGTGVETLKAVADFTRDDRFKPLPGYKTFTSHYHVEHTVDFLDRQKAQKTNGIPRGLERPGFVTKFKESGIDIVHLAEFHHGWTPDQKTADRLHMQKVMHEECARLSDDKFLLLPGEEPNVHLGGHWLSFFPKPVYWVLNRKEGEPFQETVPGFGTVYHVGSAADVLTLMEQENGLMWTAHARIKSSIKYPDDYRNTAFYQSPHFLGAAWKAMPADLSRPTLGWRILDLLDDMNQWGGRKHVVGEVDVFKVERPYELYAHLNINYLKLAQLPKFGDGWQPVLDVLRGGQFFTTTGEILIPNFAVTGIENGGTTSPDKLRSGKVVADLEWTFPLAFAEVVSGDGTNIHRQRIDLTDTQSFGNRTLRIPVDLSRSKWVRFEVWDIAANGAFTQPVWIQ